MTKAENRLGPGDDTDPDVELKREKIFCRRSLIGVFLCLFLHIVFTVSVSLFYSSPNFHYF